MNSANNFVPLFGKEGLPAVGRVRGVIQHNPLGPPLLKGEINRSVNLCC